MSRRDDHRRHKAGRERERSRSPRRSRRDERELEERAEPKLDNIGLGAKHRLKSMGIQMKLNSQRAGGGGGAATVSAVAAPKKISVATAFNQDSDDEPEEMPPEAKMRMRNIGRDTPTSSGPNSFGKTKQGFSDAKKVFEKNMREAMDTTLQKQIGSDAHLLGELIDSDEKE